MRLTVVSHKICWKSADSESGYATDGGFPLQIGAIAELFGETTVVVPCEKKANNQGVSALVGNNLKVAALSVPSGDGLRRKIIFPFWLVKNGWKIFNEVRRADAVHTPIPGDVGTIGMFCAFVLRKPLFVRHCGNWLVQRTQAERFWKWSMEKFAGGRNVMLATGGTDAPPSGKNPCVQWIFSTSLRNEQLENAVPKKLSEGKPVKLIIACRQEPRKGTATVIESLNLLHQNGNYTLDVVGDGSLLNELKAKTKELSLANRVTFHGKVAQNRVVELLQRADLFCYPTSASEGFPKVVLEALAAGLPVITTKVSVLPKLIEKGGGVLLDEASPQALAQAINTICADQNNYEQMSERAILSAKEYSLENWRDFIGENLRRSWKVDSLS